MPKDELADAAWHGVAVSDNSIDKAVSSLRQALGRTTDGRAPIESRKRKGVRLAEPVGRVKTPVPPVPSKPSPYQAYVTGRRAI